MNSIQEFCPSGVQDTLQHWYGFWHKIHCPHFRRMGRPTCFRCISLILRSPNVIQVLHQQESICHESVAEARRSCFDISSTSPGDGSFLFRSENLSPNSCGLEGKFKTAFSKRNSDIKCSIDSGTEASCDFSFSCSDNYCCRWRTVIQTWSSKYDSRIARSQILLKT